MNHSGARDYQRKRRFKYGTNAVIVTISVIGLLALSFVGVDKLLWRFDFTANRSFSLSPQTIEVLANIKQPVVIRGFFRSAGDMDQIFIRRKVDDVLREYAERSDYIDYQMLDPDVDVDQTLAFGVHTDGTVAFESGSRRKDIYRSSLFNYPSLEDNSIPLFVGESLFTNALLALAQDEVPQICFLSGHGERDADSGEAEGLSQIIQSLQSDNYQVEKISFVDDVDWAQICDALLVAGPKLGFHRREDQAIVNFVKAGKKLVLMVDPQSAIGLSATMPFLGLTFQDAVTFDPERHFLLGSHYPAPVLKAHPITDHLIAEKMSPILYLARPLSIASKGETETFQISELLSTSQVAWGEIDLKTAQKPERNIGRDLEGPLLLGAAVTKRVSPPDGSVVAGSVRPLQAGEETPPLQGDARDDIQSIPTALVFGDSNFITNGLIQIPGNSDLLLNGIAWLFGEQDQVTIRPMKPDFRPLVLEPAQASLVGYMSQLIYPGLILGLGLGYLWRRRRR